MNTIKENSKVAFNQQAATYDNDIKGQHARSLYPVLLEKLSHIPFQSALDLGQMCIRDRDEDILNYDDIDDPDAFA